ncbi:MAG: amidohydrolase family protein [Rhodobacteraceae bacterium]|nr:amidohydrolase family protein [Paracoccaceae bacterium]
MTTDVRSARPTLIRGASVLSMDRAVGELARADVLLRGDRIAAIGPSLAAEGAEVVPAEGMILMPGMIDGHRHVWESVILGHLVKTTRKYRTYLVYNNQQVAICFTPEDVYLGNYVGGLTMIDGGVTSVVDHAHIVHTPAKGEAAARGLLDSGIGGVFCYGITHSPTYGPGDTITPARGWAEFVAAPDDWHLRAAAEIRDRLFADPAGILKFGVGLSLVEFGRRTAESIRGEIASARALRPYLMTQHISGAAPAGTDGSLTATTMGLPADYSIVADLHRAGLLGPDYHLSHGNQLTDHELDLLLETGARLCATPMGEFPYTNPSIHGRAWARGLPIGIGIDVPLAFTNDFFEHLRTSFWSLYRDREGAGIAARMDSTALLSLATIEGARAIGMADEIGSIAPGKRADLVLLRTARYGFANAGTLADRVVNFAHESDVDSVWVAGRARKRDGVMAGVDWADLKARADALEKRVTAAAGTITIG